MARSGMFNHQKQNKMKRFSKETSADRQEALVQFLQADYEAYRLLEQLEQKAIEMEKRVCQLQLQRRRDFTKQLMEVMQIID